MKTITLEVSDTIAERMSKMTPAEKVSITKMIEMLVGRTKRSLSEIMNDASEQAEKNGLTPEILEQIMAEIKEERKEK